MHFNFICVSIIAHWLVYRLCNITACKLLLITKLVSCCKIIIFMWVRTNPRCGILIIINGFSCNVLWWRTFKQGHLPCRSFEAGFITWQLGWHGQNPFEVILYLLLFHIIQSCLFPTENEIFYLSKIDCLLVKLFFMLNTSFSLTFFK